MRISLGYLDPGDESELLLARARRQRERVELEPICDRDTLRELQTMVEEVHLSEAVAAYAQVRGNITSPRVSLEDGAKFKGSIEMDPQAVQGALGAGRGAAPKGPSAAPGVPSRDEAG